MPPLIVEAERISSTRIRERVLQGDLDTVEQLLGRKYSVTGVVERGRGIGSTIGFPTANIRPNHSAVPAQGVYIAEAVVGGRRLPAAVNIGIAPTIRQEDVTIEAHILDFDEDIAGREIEIVFHEHSSGNEIPRPRRTPSPNRTRHRASARLLQHPFQLGSRLYLVGSL